MSIQHLGVTTPLKRGRDTGRVINQAVPAASTTPFAFIFDMCEADHFSMQLAWTGDITAAVKVYTSNSFIPNPSDEQNEDAAIRSGVWTDRSSDFTFTAPAGSAGNTEIHGTFIEACFIKIEIAPDGSSTGASHVDGYVSVKAVE